MSRQKFSLLFRVLLFSIGVIGAGTAQAYEQYHPGDAAATGDGCYQCHGWDNDNNPAWVATGDATFRNGGFDGRGPLHVLHVSQITGTCNLCHISTGDGGFTYTSGDPAGQGCRGCHGVDPGGSPNFDWGAGLRLHHTNAGVTADFQDDLFCEDCHSDPAPQPENAVPPYYQRAEVNAKDPCNADGTEDWGGPNGDPPDVPNGSGLDNDGDLDYDADDPDCAPSTPTPTATPSVTPTTTPTGTPTATPSVTPTATPTGTATATPSVTPTATPTGTATATPSVTPTTTPTGTATATPSVTPTATPTGTATATPSVTPTAMPTGTPSATPTVTPTAEPTGTPTAMPTATPTATPTANPSATPIPAPLTSAQQMCVNEMNKNGEKVNRAQLKENERCLMDFQRGKLVAPMTFDACTIADRKGKLEKAKERTEMREGRKCNRLAVPPPFAYTDAVTVNKAAEEGALALTSAIFGKPVSDADLATKASDKDTANCQLEMLKRADKLESTVVKEINRAKRKAIKDETVGSEVALEEKLRAVFSSNDRIDKAQVRLVKRVDSKCAALPAPDTIFPGKCGDADLSEVEACVIAAARCEACLKIKTFDDLDLDCEEADDQDNGNGSCS